MSMKNERPHDYIFRNLRSSNDTIAILERRARK
jgi:hypothetical protein